MSQYIFAGFLTLLFVSNAVAQPLQVEDAVQMALSNNQRIVQANERYKAEASLLTAARRDRLPKLDFGYSYDHLRDQPFENIHGESMVVNDRDMVHYQLELSQPLFTGFALAARQKIAELGADMAAYDLQQAKQRLALEVRFAALQFLRDSSDVNLAEQRRAQLKSHLHDVDSAFNQGMIPANDRLKAKVALASAEQQLLTVQSQQQISRSRLNLLIGRSQEQPLELIEPETPSPPSKSLNQLIGIALQQRPEIETARLALAAAGEELRLARSRDYPQLAVIARYWRDGNDLAASENPYRNEDNALIGLHLSWNLFSSGADHARISAAEHQRRARQQVIRELEDNIRLQVQSALQQLEVANSNLDRAAMAVEQARENQRLTILQFRENLISTSDLLDARTLLTKAETDQLTAHYGALTALAQLSYALGAPPLAEGQQ